jgi:hypothetical protein
VSKVIPLTPSKRMGEWEDDIEREDAERAPLRAAGRTGNSDKRRRKEEYARERNSLSVDDLFAEMGIKSFSQEYKRLSKMTGDDDFSSTQTTAATRRALLAMMINFLPRLEENSHRFPNERSAYALAAIVSSIRELAHDLEARGDQGELAERIRREAIQPTLTTLATSVVSNLTKTRQLLHTQLPPKEAGKVDKVLRKQQAELVQLFAAAEVNAAERLTSVTVTK